MSQYSNEPLDRQFHFVVNNISKKEEKVPAIDRLFMEERNFLTYKPPPFAIFNVSDPEYQAAFDEYQERLKLIDEDLSWLLARTYQQFWCQMIYDESCKKLVDSFLKMAPRPHDVFKLKNLPTPIVKLHGKVHKSIFLVCLRLSTYKESKENHMTPEVYAKAIYNNYLFDIPKIFDLCVLYKKNQLLPKMIDNLFKTQQKYYDDFKTSVKDILSLFEKAKQNLRKAFDLDSVYYSEGSIGSRKASAFLKVKDNIQFILELIYYLTDFSITLADLASIQCQVFKYLMDQKFEHHIKELMENTLFNIEDFLNNMLKDSDSSINEAGALIKVKLKKLKYKLAKLFKEILESGSTKQLIANLDNPAFSQDQIRVQEQELVDYFIQICCDVMEEKRFLCYYEEQFSLSEQIMLIAQLSNDKIDESQQRFLLDNLKSSVLLHSRKKSVRGRFGAGGTKSAVSVNPSTSGASQASNTEYTGDEEADGLVQSVLDLLPGTDTTLIKKCLKYYDNNVEQVINAFLENNLPEFSAEMDTVPEDMDIVGVEVEDNDCVTSKFSELSLRKNVYDGDQFDVFSKKEVDMKNVVLGKKNEIETLDLDDKSELDREYFRNYDQMMHERMLKEQAELEGNFANEYEDEYDDTYDDKATANDEPEPYEFIKPLNQKLEIKKRDAFGGDEDDEAEDRSSMTSQQGYRQRPQHPQGRFNNNQFRGNDFNQQQQSSNRSQFNNDQRPDSRNQRDGNRNQYNDQKAGGNRDQTNQRNQNQSSSQPQQNQNQQQQQRPLLQRAPKPQRNRAQGGGNSFQQQDQNQDSKQFSQKFQDKYAKTSSSKDPIESNIEPGGPQLDPKQPTAQNKTAEQIKRDRKWKNDHKNSHRKDQAAKKNNLF